MLNLTDKEQKEVFSSNLQYYVRRSGKEQKQIAFDIGEKPTTFNSWVKGKAIPAVTILHKVAEYFGVRLEDIVNEREEQYYINPETAKIAQKIYEDSHYRILFDAAENSRPEDLLMAADMLNRFKETNPNG